MRPHSILPLASLAIFASSTPATAQIEDSLARAERLYVAQCARCHGVDGGGGEGPALLGRQFARVSDDESLMGVIQEGISGTAMPGAGWIDDEEAELIALYVRRLSRVEVEPVPGDPEAGRVLFEEKGDCSSCHIVSGRGDGIGPELSDIGARRDARYLRRSLMNPGAVLPRGELGPHSSFLIVRADLADGRTIRGMRVIEDAFVLVLRDREGAYHTLIKSDVAALEREVGVSFMPDYEDLMSEDEIMNLVAYMASLRGSR